MTTKQTIKAKINKLERKIECEKEYIEDLLKQIQNGVPSIEHCRDIIRDYDFSKKLIEQSQKDLQLLQLAIKAIEEESK